MMARCTVSVSNRPARSRLPRGPFVRVGLALMVLALRLGASPAGVRAAETVEVATVVLSEQTLAPGRDQIVQVTLRNSGAGPVSVGVRVTLASKAGKALDKPMQHVVSINAYDEQRSYFTMKAPRQNGEYRVLLGLFSSDFKRRLDAQEPAFYATFTVGPPGQRPVAAEPPPAASPGSPSAPGQQKPAATSFPPPGGLQFEAADLLWENIGVTPPNFLIGDTGRVRAELVNVGGDVARDIAVRVRYFNSRIPNKVEPVADSSVAALAPGERIELEWEFKFPDTALLGEYRIVMEARLPEGMTDANPANNRVTYAQVVQLSNIRLVFPDPDYTFDEAGLFLFRWESKVYKEYKVQVGVDSGFQDPSRFFDIPQGDKWAVEQEVVPLEGELPVMGRGLMERFQSKQVYWRVVGRDTEQNRTGISRVQQFTIRLGEPKAGAAPPVESEDAVPEPKAPPEGDIVPPLPPAVPAVPAPPAQSGQKAGGAAPSQPGAQTAPPSPGGAAATPPPPAQPAQGAAAAPPTAPAPGGGTPPPPASAQGGAAPPPPAARAPAGATPPPAAPAQGAAPPPPANR